MLDKLKKALLVPFLIVIMVCVGYLMLVLVYVLPTNRIEENIKESCILFENEGTYIELMGNDNSQLDNYTDAIMLMTAAHPRSESYWKAAINVASYANTDQVPVKTLLNVYRDGEIGESASYARYWHGYLVFLKPLLLFFNYGQIRSVLMFIQLGLLIMLLMRLSKKMNEWFSLLF